jgi:hypothetical protein
MRICYLRVKATLRFAPALRGLDTEATDPRSLLGMAMRGRNGHDRFVPLLATLPVRSDPDPVASSPIPRLHRSRPSHLRDDPKNKNLKIQQKSSRVVKSDAFWQHQQV